MKKVIFIILFGLSSLFGTYNECITDIYFGNGVWNDYKGANEGRTNLEKQILSRLYHGDIQAFKANHFTNRGNHNLNKNIVLLAFN